MNDDTAAQQHEEPAEHLRFRDYLNRLEQVPGTEEFGLVSEVLSDPHQGMAQSAVLRHLDRRAASLHPRPDYETWAEGMAQAVDRYPFLSRRLHEWSLFRAVKLSEPWSPDALLASSDWLQLTTAEALDATALEILAERGRTKRIRHTARTRLRQLSQRRPAR